MTDRQHVQFVETEPTLGCLHIHDDCFSYQPSRGWIWMQKACFWLLDRLRCHHSTEFTSYRRITIDRQASMAALFEQQSKLMRVGQGAELLLIGSEDWMEIMRTESPQFSPITFYGDYFVPNYTSGEDRPIWRGGGATIESRPIRKQMRVCIIPWMKGMVMVPRQALEERQ